MELDFSPIKKCYYEKWLTLDLILSLQIVKLFFFYSIGIRGTPMLLTSLSLTAEFIGSNTSSLAFVYCTKSFLDKLLTRFGGVFFRSSFQKIPHPVGNLSKKLMVAQTNAKEKEFEQMNSAVKERLVTSIVVPLIPKMTFSNF